MKYKKIFHFIINRVKIITTLQYYFSLIIMTKIQNNTIFQRGCGKQALSNITVWNVKWYHPYGGQFCIN